jgi:hypothetical protein
MDQLGQSSLLKFVIKFGALTMIIYNALLQEKRILMAGDLSFPISSIIDFVLAAASLVSPPFLGIQSKVYPHVHLKELGVLAAETSYIAGVTNPTFLMQKQLYDISC